MGSLGVDIDFKGSFEGDVDVNVDVDINRNIDVDIVLLGGSWDLVTRVISKVTIVIIAYSPN